MKVINKYKENPPPKSVWIMRGYKYGNPFVMRNESDEERARVCTAYKLYADNKFTDKEILTDLGGKILVCCCKPKRCHGDYLIERIKKIKDSRTI